MNKIFLIILKLYGDDEHDGGQYSERSQAGGVSHVLVTTIVVTETDFKCFTTTSSTGKNDSIIFKVSTFLAMVTQVCNPSGYAEAAYARSW